MLRRAIIVGVVLILAGCGATLQHRTDSQCARYKAAAEAWAQNYVAPLPAAVSHARLQQLADAQLKVLATSHGLVCN